MYVYTAEHTHLRGRWTTKEGHDIFGHTNCARCNIFLYFDMFSGAPLSFTIVVTCLTK